MEEPAAIQTAEEPALRSSRWSDLKLLALLLALAAGIHLWLIRHTEVTARDGVGFIRYAWQLQTQPWAPVLRENPHPPIYPLTVLAMSYPVRQLAAGNDQAVMQLSAQLASALAGTLLVIPMFYLGRQFFDRRVAFWAAALFQCLPGGSRVLADALSEAIFLLLTATATLLAIQAVRSRRPSRFAWSGLFGSLAYLARPEGILIILAQGLVLLGAQLIPSWRRPWRQTIVCGVSVTLVAVAIASPYIAVIGRFTNKITGQDILHTSVPDWKSYPQARGGSPPLAASLFAVYNQGSKEVSLLNRHIWCLASVWREVAKGYHYIAWAPALVALIYFRKQFCTRPEIWVCWGLIFLDVLLLWRVAFVAGYLAERHSLLIVMSSIVWAVGGITIIAEHLGRWLSRSWFPSSGKIWALLILLALAGSGLPKTLEPLHTNRAGFHAAGLWLADHAQPGDLIIDPFSWTEYYAGQVRRQLQAPRSPPQFIYVVLGGTKTEHERLPMMPVAKKCAENGVLVFQWQPHKIKAEEVQVYQVRTEDISRMKGGG
jgi:hypothetical protein